MFKNRNVFLVLGIIGAFVYYNGFSIGLIGDDFQFTFPFFPKNPFYFFSHALPNCLSYRPLQALVMAGAQHCFGVFNTFPMHALTLFFHVVVCFSVYYVCIQSGIGRLPAFLSSLFMLVSQTNVMAVSGNDTLSQILVTLFGCLSLWTLWKATSAGNPVNKRNALSALSLALFVLCLLSKETAVSFFVQVLVLLGFSRARKRTSTIRSIIVGAFYSLTVLVYWIIHASLPLRNASFGYAPYDLYPGLNVFSNAVQFAVSLFSPLSTVSVCRAFFYKDIVFLLFTGLVLLLVISLSISGTVKSRQKRIFIAVPILGLTGFFPLVLMNHVSELYTYQFAPFFSIIIGIGISHFITGTRQNPIKNLVVLIITAFFFAGNIYAVEKKIVCVKKNGKQAASLYTQLAPIIKQTPQNAYMYLVNPQEQGPQYSVFLIKGFNVLEYGLLPIGRLLQRDDVAITIVDLPVSKTCGCTRHFYDPPKSGSPILLTLDENRVIPYVLSRH
jgi:hypothetical protein